ncbi:YtxH domain-containing protein [Chondromyces apiculatus]|uniref:YtxH domain-containing protein n=1 Tax=Chondromyces apiculatus DSM 436 TaxID=1192034 RepID=A0A017TG52_9BACT|nr:YtxH domain-containing protein [Chondromyces apiculatus]EYF07536.1 Hypothetical protein CAP_8659 [Chondromyces apiculatus DSM 436]
MSMLEDNMNVALKGVDYAKDSVEHTVAKGVSVALKGVTAAAGVLAAVRHFSADDGLAWFGLARRRSPLQSVALVGAGVIAGVGIGAGLGLLFAPRPGAETRRALRQQSEKIQGDAKNLLAQASTEVKAVGETVQQNVQQFAEKARDAVKPPTTATTERKLNN